MPSDCKNTGYCSDEAELLNTSAPILRGPLKKTLDDYSSSAELSKSAPDVDDDGDTPDCCRGRVRPCCDTSCLELVARRECERSAAASHGLTAETNTSSVVNIGKPCNKHTISALDRYGAMLRALGCICRALVVSGQETCCKIRESHSLDEQDPSRKSSAQSRRGASRDGCNDISLVHKDLDVKDCLGLKKRFSGSVEPGRPLSTNTRNDSCSANDKLAKDSRARAHCHHEKHAQQSTLETESLGPDYLQTPRTKDPTDDVNPTKHNDKYHLVNEPSNNGRARWGSEADNDTIINVSLNAASFGSCCNRIKQDTVEVQKSGRGDSCRAENRLVSPRDSCADVCCSAAAPDPEFEIGKNPLQATTDVENHGTGGEHVILSISGMTCTGCETKLNRTLAAVPAVKDLKTSLVLSRAEFTIDLRIGSIEEILKYIERTTEFKCERVHNQGSSLDLVVFNGPSEFISQQWPDGIIDMTPVDKQTVRVVFDPKVVGARDLLEKIWAPSIKLAPPCRDPSLEAGSSHVRNVGYWTLLSAGLTIPVLVMAWAPLPDHEVAYSSASFALATIVQVAIAGPFYPKALKALFFSRVVEMDLLIVLSTSAAYIFSVVSFVYLVAGKPLPTGQFFETSTLLVTLVMVGRWTAAFARQKAVESISISSLQASTAILVDEESGTEREIDTRILQYGDTFKVLPDTKIPTDGTVITGSSEIDESMLTGESRPVMKHPDSVVVAGSINGPGVLTVRLNRLPSDNTVTAIAAMVDEAKLSKPKLQDLADRVASYFVPVVVTLTIITFVIWVVVGMVVRGYGGSDATINAITYAITVLIICCPCAIGLAVPMVIVISGGVLAEKGIIIKSATAIEVAYKAKHVVFDKTGTLTCGRLSVTAEACAARDKLPLLLGLVENSRHPVSVAVAAHLKNAGIIASIVPASKSLIGKGIETALDGQRLRAGNSSWLHLSDNELVKPMLARGYSVFCFTINDALLAVYGLEDELRPDAASTIKALQKRGVSVHLISGDDDGAVRTLASKLGIPGDNVRSQNSPADKKDYIDTLLSTRINRTRPVVVFCGDGTNDAVALAHATIGVHINEGTDVAQSAADVVLMRPSLAGILLMMDASRACVNRIKFNITWSFVYNTFAILFAAGAFVDIRIPPAFAGLGELVSVLPVIAASLLLRWWGI